MGVGGRGADGSSAAARRRFGVRGVPPSPPSTPTGGCGCGVVAVFWVRPPGEAVGRSALQEGTRWEPLRDAGLQGECGGGPKMQRGGAQNATGGPQNNRGVPKHYGGSPSHRELWGRECAPPVLPGGGGGGAVGYPAVIPRFGVGHCKVNVGSPLGLGSDAVGYQWDQFPVWSQTSGRTHRATPRFGVTQQRVPVGPPPPVGDGAPWGTGRVSPRFGVTP